MQKILSSLLTIVLFVLLAVAFLHPSSELSLDLGEHIRFGEQIVKYHFFPTTNIFSYTYPNAPFIHQEFLPDILFYLLYTAGGINALILMTVGIVLAAFGLVFFYVSKRVSPVVLFTASFLFLRIMFERTYVRPEIFSYLFLSIFIVVLLTYRQHFTRWIYLLIPLQFLWMNSHIYFIFGLFLLGLTFIELIVTKQYKNRIRDIQVLGEVLLASCLVCLINPNGLTGLLYPFTVFHNYGFSVQENNSIFTIEQENPGTIIYSILFFKISTVLLILFLLLRTKSTGIFNWIASLSFIVLAASAIRNFPLFVFGAFVPFVLSAEHAWAKFFMPKITIYKTIVIVCIQLFLLGVFLWQTNQVIAVQGIGLGSTDAAKKAVTFLESNHVHGPLFNNYGIGSYLVFRLFPKEHVFVDGRPEAYPASFFSQIYTPMQMNATFFQKVSQQYKFNAIIYDYPAEQTTASQIFLKNIMHNPDWKPIYLDDTAVVLVKNSPKNKILIEKYALSESSFNLRQVANSESSLENLAYFFTVVGWQEKEGETYHDILQLDPTNCAALAYEIANLSSRNDPGVIVLESRYQITCHQ